MPDAVSRPEELRTTLTTTIYEQLKEDILEVRLEPGRKLPFRFLMQHYGVGQTPLREALNRLSSEDLVVALDQRGFHIKPVDLRELAELTKTRCWVEGIALRESMRNATQAWEESLLVAHHRLDRTARSLDPAAFANNPEWERLHRLFHATLIEACDSRPLIAFCAQLAERLHRYRMMSIRKAFRERKVGSEHAEIMRAVLNRHVELAVDLLQQHFQRTADIIYADLAES